MTESDDVYVDILVTLVAFREEFDSFKPIDPERLPGKIVEILKNHCVGRNMPIVDGRMHYHGFDVLEALEVRARQ
jgi:hypothetical protein